MPALDLDGISRSVVKLRAEVPEDAFTAGVLGSQRTGNGVVINADGTGRHTIANNAGHDQIGIVEGRSVSMAQRISEFSALVDAARCLRGDVARDAARKAELLE